MGIAITCSKSTEVCSGAAKGHGSFSVEILGETVVRSKEALELGVASVEVLCELVVRAKEALGKVLLASRRDIVVGQDAVGRY
ncbi:unnamed protein product [Ilex paraguariensis]|uniref:Uncharacterized protein n=1 Tax=Ilex paraguariensis TaxID=185542 RepID=A0ABC8S5T8_9AQUA